MSSVIITEDTPGSAMLGAPTITTEPGGIIVNVSDSCYPHSKTHPCCQPIKRSEQVSPLSDYSMMIPIARQSALRAVRSQFQPSRAFNQPTASALARLLSTLAVLEQRDGKLQNSSLSAIAAAQKLGGSVTAFVAGAGVKGTAAAEAAKIKGLDKVLAVENDAYEKVRVTRVVIK
jgi:hypothetical protein